MTTIWHRFNTVLLLLVLFALLAVIGMLAAGVRGGPLDPPGVPGSTDSVRLPGTPIDGPFVIGKPGHYYLTRNIEIPALGIGIEIDADDVTFDLGGFTIAGANLGDTGILVADVKRIRITNGIIRTSNVGVGAASVEGLEISGVSVHGGSVGFELPAGAMLDDCVVASTGARAIEINGGNVTVRHCVIENNDGTGVFVSGSGGDGALIERSVIKRNNIFNDADSGGIVVGADLATIRNNDMRFNNVADVLVLGIDNVIADNIIDCPTSIVLEPSSSNTFAPVNTTDPHTNLAHRLAC